MSYAYSGGVKYTWSWGRFTSVVVSHQVRLIFKTIHLTLDDSDTLSC
jgi:hypothetical protein